MEVVKSQLVGHIITDTRSSNKEKKIYNCAHISRDHLPCVCVPVTVCACAVEVASHAAYGEHDLIMESDSITTVSPHPVSFDTLKMQTPDGKRVHATRLDRQT